MIVIGHRGCPRKAVENTMESLRIAQAEGADGVEFDVQWTADGEPVLFHDDSLRRLAGMPLRIGRLDWREVRDLTVAAPGLRAQPIAHFDQVLDWWGQSRLTLNVELKVPARSPPPRVDHLAHCVARRLAGAAGDPLWLGRLVVSSFSSRALAAVAGVAPHLRRAALIDERPLTDFWSLNQPQATDAIAQVHPPIRQLSSDKLVRWKALGWPVWPWTVNEPRDWERTAQWALAGLVQGAITDEPGALRRFIDRHAPALRGPKEAP
ncbi:MAG: hypothetical protein FJ100_07665 [Deltaproteobacteria bacterium]|nr:hypothetical protein [Deltaproteobacteria bacterium]